MPKWKKDAREFTVAVNFNPIRGFQTSIPRPVAEALGRPDSITYIVRGKRIEIKPAGKSRPYESK
jgi:hypothetical protein